MNDNITLTTNEAEAGLKATLHCFDERKFSCTVIKVSGSGKTVMVQEDAPALIEINEKTGEQLSTHVPNPQGAIHVYTLGVTGGWKRKDKQKSPLLYIWREQQVFTKKEIEVKLRKLQEAQDFWKAKLGNAA